MIAGPVSGSGDGAGGVVGHAPRDLLLSVKVQRAVAGQRRGCASLREKQPGVDAEIWETPWTTMATEELARKLQRRLTVQQCVHPDSQSSAAAGDNCVKPAGGDREEKAAAAAAATANASSELSAKLSRRLDINQGTAQPKQTKIFNPYTEFKEFTRKQIKDMEKMFKRYDAGKDGFIDLMELKLMMEKLGAPQTHLGLKNMIKEVDEDFDGKLSFREFLLIFQKAAAGELQEESGLLALARLSEIDVSTEGVLGARDFFEAKVQALAVGSKFEAEIREEKEEKKRQEQERKRRRAAFKELQSAFNS